MSTPEQVPFCGLDALHELWRQVGPEQFVTLEHDRYPMVTAHDINLIPLQSAYLGRSEGIVESRQHWQRTIWTQQGMEFLIRQHPGPDTLSRFIKVPRLLPAINPTASAHPPEEP